MFFLKRLTLAVFANKRYSNKTMEIELEDCASYESFCYSIQSTKKSRFSSFFTTGDDSESDSDSDDFNWGVDNSSGWDNTGSDIEWDDDNSNTEWTNDDQSYQDEIMDELEIVFEDETDRSAFIRKVNRDWNEANKDINKKGRSATKVSFAPDEALVEVLPADICERKGEWEMRAIDRLRFQKRINDTEAILAPYLSKEHRSKISLMLQIDVEQKLCSISK